MRARSRRRPHHRRQRSPPRRCSSPAGPIFRSLFQAGERAQPVSPAVQELWGNGASLTSVPSSQTPNVRAPQPLDLFSDRNGTFSGQT